MTAWPLDIWLPSKCCIQAVFCDCSVAHPGIAVTFAISVNCAAPCSLGLLISIDQKSDSSLDCWLTQITDRQTRKWKWCFVFIMRWNIKCINTEHFTLFIKTSANYIFSDAFCLEFSRSRIKVRMDPLFQWKASSFILNFCSYHGSCRICFLILYINISSFYFCHFTQTTITRKSSQSFILNQNHVTLN